MFRVFLLINLLFACGGSGAFGDEIIKIEKPDLRSVRFVDDAHGWIAGYKGVFHTNDGGLTWQRQPITIGRRDRFTTTSAVINTGWIAWANKTSAIIRSDEGLVIGDANTGQWQSIKIPMKILETLNALSFVDQQRGWGAGDSGRIYITDDGGVTWQLIRLPAIRQLISLFAISATEAWAVGEDTSVVHTTDAGQSWKRQALYRGMSKYGATAMFLSTQFVTRQKGWICGTDGLIFHTNDGGETWEKQTSSYSYGTGLGAMSFASEDEGWAIGKQSLKGGQEERVMLYTRNGGALWETRIIDIDENLTSIQALPNGRAWVVSARGTVLRTADYGYQWTQIKIE